MSFMFWYESMKFFFFFWCELFQFCFILTKMRFWLICFIFFCLIYMPVGAWSVSNLDGELLFSGFLRICQGFWSGVKDMDLQICWLLFSSPFSKLFGCSKSCTKSKLLMHLVVAILYLHVSVWIVACLSCFLCLFHFYLTSDCNFGSLRS